MGEFVTVKDCHENILLLKKDIEAKVSYKSFWSIFSILVIILIAVFGYVTMQMGDIRMLMISTREDVAKIIGRLEPYSFTRNTNK